jgi:aspartate carbamoyltransferase catalytic subunit
VINAGDGQGGQHPTQALLDLYTIYRERPLDGLSIAFIGELDRGRTVRFLAYLLVRFDRLKLVFVSPAELQMRPGILEYLDRHNVDYEMVTDMDKVLGKSDVILPDQNSPRTPAQPCRPGAHNYHPLDVVIERAEGVWVFDVEVTREEID